MKTAMKPLDLKTGIPVRDSVCILGIPYDENSSFRKGPALGPDRIRENYFSESANLWTETGMDLGASNRVKDCGNLDMAGFPTHDTSGVFNSIRKTVAGLLTAQARVVALGGDHSVTFPIVQAHAGAFPNLNILHLDAHPDLYDSLKGNRFSHACPFARIMEAHPHIRLVQAGIRTLNDHQREQAARFGVEIHEMKNGFGMLQDLFFDGPVYLSLDLDCLDPAFAPGVSHHEPGGFSTRQVIDIIQGFRGRLIGADIVEYNPDRDFISMTGMTAAKLLKEILGRMLLDNPAGGVAGDG